MGDAFQEREIRALSSQMKQALIKRLQENVMALSKLKKKRLESREDQIRQGCAFNSFGAVRRDVLGQKGQRGSRTGHWKL